MKLINKTYRLSFFMMIPLFVLSSVFVYYMINYIVYEETDEYLTYEMKRLVKYHEINNDLPDFHLVAEVLDDTFLSTPIFKDTLLLESGDNEMVPYRELHFSLQHNGENKTLVLRHLLLGKDDVFEGALAIMAGLILLFASTMYLMVNQFSKRIWNPFYNTLELLSKYRLHGGLPDFQKSGVEEFDTMNKTAMKLLNKIEADFKRTKAFNENASHEFQTRLAVIRGNTEEMMNNKNLDPMLSEQLQSIYNHTLQLSQTQKSLLLLSKIGNQEYENQVKLNLADILKQSINLFQEAIDLRAISLDINVSDCYLNMDSGLADIMINNLLKNAVKYNFHQGFIRIRLEKASLMIENSGPESGLQEQLFTRFQTGPNGNLGIGLAIVKEICELYAFTIGYRQPKQNTHLIQITF